MRVMIGVVLLAVAAAATAQAGSGTLRVGSQVLVVGDSASRVIELLGKPAYKGHGGGGTQSRGKSGKSNKSGKGGKTASKETGGEQWQYRLGSRAVTVVIADGRVAAIHDSGR